MEDSEKNILKIKSGFKKALKSVIKIKKIIIVGLILFVLIFISMAEYDITILNGKEGTDDDEKRGSTRYTSNVTPTVSEDGSAGLKVDKDALVKDALTDRKYSEDKINNMSDEEIIKKLDVNRKLKKSTKVTSLDQLTNAEILWCTNDIYSKYLKKPEELEKLLNAEIITQYPKMSDKTDGLDGIIQFERNKEDGTSTMLKYIDSDTFNDYVSNKDSKVLDYFTLDDDENAVIAYKNTSTETLTSNDDEMNVSDYTSSLSEDNKESDGEYKKVTTTIGTQRIDYKNVTKKYVMPFKYLWALLVIGKDRSFVSELADLVENSEITISIYDNITTTTDTDVYTYKKETRTDTYVKVTPSTTYGLKNVPTKGYWWPADKIISEGSGIGDNDLKNDADYETDETEYNVTHKIVNKTNKVQFALTKANVWIVDYSQEYTYQEAQTTTDEANTNDSIEDTDYVRDDKESSTSDENSALLNSEHAQEMTRKTREYIEKNKPKETTTSRALTSITGEDKKKSNSVFDSAIENDVKKDTSTDLLNVTKKDETTKGDKSDSSKDTTSTEPLLSVLPTYVSCDKYKHKIDRKQTTTNTVSEQKYVSKTPVNNPKVDPKSDQDNFVKILRKGKHKDAKDYLTSEGTQWLWKIMESTCPDMIDLTKYLFYKTTGKSYGVKEFEFSIFSSNEIVDFNSSGSASDLLVEYIHSWEGSNPPMSADGTKYIIEDDGYGNLVLGYGVDIYNCGYTDLFKQAGYTLALGAEVDKEFVDSIEKLELEDKTNGIRNALAGLNLTEYQTNAMISRAYQSGSSGAITTRNGKNFVEAYTAYWDQSRDDKFSKKDPNADFSHQLYSTYMYLPNTASGVYSPGVENRRKSEWTLFQTGYYDRIDKWHSEGGSVIDVAKKIHNYMEENAYTYCVFGANGYEECSGGGHGLNATFETSKTGYHHACCATFVSWVLQDAGYLDDSEHSDSASGLEDVMKNKGFQMITNEAELQAGDVLCYSGHVEIYAGDNKIYNAGSGNAIRNASPSNRTRRFDYALRPTK